MYSVCGVMQMCRTLSAWVLLVVHQGQILWFTHTGGHTSDLVSPRTSFVLRILFGILEGFALHELATRDTRTQLFIWPTKTLRNILSINVVRSVGVGLFRLPGSGLWWVSLTFLFLSRVEHEIPESVHQEYVFSFTLLSYRISCLQVVNLFLYMPMLALQATCSEEPFCWTIARYVSIGTFASRHDLVSYFEVSAVELFHGRWKTSQTFSPVCSDKQIRSTSVCYFLDFMILD